MQVERPRIALNAQLFRLNEGYRSAGIARYQLHLLRELSAAAGDFNLDLFATEPLAPSLLSGYTIRQTRLPVHKPLARILWEQTVFAYNLLQQNFDLLHSLAYVSPLLNRTRSIVTIYDLSFYLYPEYFKPFQRLYLQLGTRLSARRAARIVAISASTKRDVIRLLNIPAEKIDVAVPGIDPIFFQNLETQAIENFRRAKNLPDQFILYLGTREPRKNIPSLLHAFALAKRQSKFPHRLVLAGGRGWLDTAITQTIQELDLTADVILPGFVPDAELPLWYRAADVFVYPSQYEGFGMPPLEALASGTPVITSNISSLPEAVGDAAILIDPQSPDQIAAALVHLITDPSLRSDLINRGMHHARQFTWTRTAQITAATYHRALGLSPESDLAPLPLVHKSTQSPISNL